MTAETWRLHSMAWQLIYTLQKTLGGLTGTFWEARSGLVPHLLISAQAVNATPFGWSQKNSPWDSILHFM